MYGAVHLHTAGRWRETYSLQGEFGNIRSIDPTVKEPVQRFLSFIIKGRRHDLLKGALQIARGDLVVGRARQQSFQRGEEQSVTFASACFTQHGTEHVDQPGSPSIDHRIV